jgi:S-DNA-T family DNA segregation ATPase FtsK/SpoIIIE
MDYAIADAPADAFGVGTPPGRGFLDGREVQVAVIGGDGDLSTQGSAIEQFGSALARHRVIVAPPIETLPARVALSELRAGGDRPVVGLSDDTLAPLEFRPEGCFLVAGPPRSGRSTAVATMLRSLTRHRPGTELVLLGQRRSPLTSVVAWAAAAHGPTEIEQLAVKLTSRFAETAGRSIVVVVEAIGELLDTEADMPLQQLLRVCRDHGAFVVAEGETSTVGGSWPLLQAVKSSRFGLVLQPDQMDGEMLFKTPFPRTTRPEFPAGRGLMVQGGQVCKVQVALPE